MQHKTPHRTITQYSATQCNILQHGPVIITINAHQRCRATVKNTLQHTATHCNMPATPCNTTHRTALQHNALQHTATYCNTLQQTATHTYYDHHQCAVTTPRHRRNYTVRHYSTLQRACIALQHNTPQYTAPKRTATHVKGCNTVQHSATHYCTLQNTATHCNADLLCTATHCNMLQHTATQTYYDHHQS